MKGDRANYGKKKDCRRVELRLYGEDKQYIETLARFHKKSYPDMVRYVIELARGKWIGD